jgi:hypothetical protein
MSIAMPTDLRVDTHHGRRVLANRDRLTPGELEAIAAGVRKDGLAAGWKMRHAWAEYVARVHARVQSYEYAAELCGISRDAAVRCVRSARRLS